MGEFRKLNDGVLSELKVTLGSIDEQSVSVFLDALAAAEKVFVMGLGRSMLMTQAFAKRLAHIGINASVVGSVTGPPMTAKDLLVASSASGETKQTVAVSRLAKELGGRVAVVTAAPGSTLASLADIVVRIPAPTKLHRPGEPTSVQPMNNLFEQASLLFYDCIAMLMQKRLGVTTDQMWRAHANLE